MKWTCSKCGNYRECSLIDGEAVCVSCQPGFAIGLDILRDMMGMK